MTIDEALDALRDAMEAVGVPGWDAPATLADLEELEAELASMRLPEAVRRFWTLVDAWTLRVEPFPAFTRPDFALRTWRMARDEFAAFQPLALVMVGYTSHVCMSVELDVGDVAGGALFEWRNDDRIEFTRRFDGIIEWVEHMTQLVREGRYTRLDGERGPSLRLADADTAPPQPHPVHGAATHLNGDVLAWPPHWQRANGFRPEHLLLKGATHTVAEVLASPPDRQLRGTIAAEVVSLMGGIGVDDGTGRLDVVCDPPPTLLEPCLGSWYEFDIVVAPGPRRAPADNGEPTATSGHPVAAFRARHSGLADATAEAVRRMPQRDSSR
jgi:hypothetical protein